METARDRGTSMGSIDPWRDIVLRLSAGRGGEAVGLAGCVVSPPPGPSLLRTWLHHTTPRSMYTTQAGSTILYLNVVSLCELRKSLVNIWMPDSFITHRNVFYVYSRCQISLKKKEKKDRPNIECLPSNFRSYSSNFRSF